MPNGGTTGSMSYISRRRNNRRDGDRRRQRGFGQQRIRYRTSTADISSRTTSSAAISPVTSPLGNNADGVTIDGYSFSPSANNTIGGTDNWRRKCDRQQWRSRSERPRSPETGLNVGNAILSNSIFGNTALGIDLGGDGVTPNHTGGLIIGPNGFQNYPVLTSAVGSATQTTIQGSLNGAPNTTYTIQFFSNVNGGSVWIRTGSNYLGSTSVDDGFHRQYLFQDHTPDRSGSRFSSSVRRRRIPMAIPPNSRRISPSRPAVRSRFATGSFADIDGALESLFLGVIDEVTLDTLAGVLTRAQSKSR